MRTFESSEKAPRVHKCARTMEFLETLIIIKLRLLKCQLSSRIIFSAKLALGMVRRTFHDNSSPSFCNHPVSGSRRPPQLDLRLDGESPFSGQDRGLTADVRLSTILPAIMLERWHHSSVSYSTQVQLAPQSSKLGPWREIHIQGYCTAQPSD